MENSEPLPADSLGIVTPEVLHFSEPLTLESGSTLDSYDLIAETYGKLNNDASNAILVCHALSGDHHAAGFHAGDDKPGWWENCIGPGKPIDTDRFFIVCPNNLGGCGGSTGPTTISPDTGKPYGPDFPLCTVRDWVASQARLGERLGVSRWFAVIGGSLGGMQVIQWAIDYPDQIAHALVIAAAPRLSTQNIAFNEVARQAIRSDPKFHNGHYYEHDVVPVEGLRLARMLGHITYLSGDGLRARFGRELRDGKLNFDYEVDFQVESYLRHQGQSFGERFDANTYLLMTKALDYFDPASRYNDDLNKALAKTQAHFLVVSFSSDWRFAPPRSREIVRALLDQDKAVSYAEIDSEQGHDSFLLEVPLYHKVLRTYLDKALAQ
jgi:homoserine O-acetyltransferase